MANEKNLKPLNERTKSERREIAIKGGKASGKARRDKKTYKELAKAMLSAKIENEEMIEVAKAFGIKDPDVKMMTLLGIIRASIGGSHNAFDRLVELTGENSGENDEGLIQELVKEFKKL